MVYFFPDYIVIFQFVVLLETDLVHIGTGKLGVSGLNAPDSVGRAAFSDADLAVIIKREPTNVVDSNAILVFAHTRCPVSAVRLDEPNVVAYLLPGNGPIIGAFDLTKRIGRIARTSARHLSPLIDGHTLMIRNVSFSFLLSWFFAGECLFWR